MTDKIFPNSTVVEEHSVYQCVITVVNVDDYTALKLTGKNEEGLLTVNRDLKKNGEVSTVFFTKSQAECLEFKVISKCSKPIIVKDIIKDFRLEKIGSTKKHVELKTNEKTVCAAIATYPARRASLLETINSLINQIDYLLLYLNEYQEIPQEIKQHGQRQKIICVIDEAGARRAEAKFHWMHRVNGYYLTCDDDIIYPGDYVQNTITAIDRHNRKKVVGYHGVVFKDIVASFKADRKAFYKFTETVDDDKPCHLLGTGVSGFHLSLFQKLDCQLLSQYPYAVDPAFSVICKQNDIEMLCLAHKTEWLESSPHMLYGLHEEKQNFKDKKRSVDNLLTQNNPWGKGSIPAISVHLKKNAKVRKLINNPKQFFKDSRFGGLFN